MSQTIFLSYARYDDAKPPGQPTAPGFVSRLIEELKFEFGQMTRPSPEIWVDVDKVRDGELFDPKIQNALSNASLFVPVLSSNWLESEFCRKELAFFRQRWASEDDETFKRRITVVHRNFVARDARPAYLSGQVGYRFFDFPNAIEESNGERFFFDRGKVLHEAQYWEAVRKLARDVWEKTRSDIRTAPAPSADVKPAVPTSSQPVSSHTAFPQTASPPPVAATVASIAAPATRNGRTIYLAKPSLDLELAYQRVAGELLAQGFDIRPRADATIPCDGAAVGFIDEAMAACELSVHLLGNDPGFAIVGGETSVRLQLACAARRVEAASSDEGGFRRLVWAPRIVQAKADVDGVRKTIERDPLQVLQTTDRFLPTDKVDGGGVNDFVIFLLQNLDAGKGQLVNTEADPVGPRSDAAAADPCSCYIYHNSIDARFARSIAKALHRNGVETMLPGQKGDDGEREALHRRYLRECDAIVLCWGDATDTWAKSYSAELRDWRTLGRSKQFKVRGLVVGPPVDEDKEDIDELWPKSQIDVVIPVTSPDGLSIDTFTRLGLGVLGG